MNAKRTPEEERTFQRECAERLPMLEMLGKIVHSKAHQPLLFNPDIWTCYEIEESEADVVNLTFPRAELRLEPEGAWRLCAHRHSAGSSTMIDLSGAHVHSHPWPMAVWSFGPGAYQMFLGADGRSRSDVALGDMEQIHSSRARELVRATMLMSPGSGYELLDGSVVHGIRAIGGPVYTLMLVGPSPLLRIAGDGRIPSNLEDVFSSQGGVIEQMMLTHVKVQSTTFCPAALSPAEVGGDNLFVRHCIDTIFAHAKDNPQSP